MIIFTEGDVWEAFDTGASIAHGCNLQGVMGAGIAKQVKERFPSLYNAYRDKCSQGDFLLGNVFPYLVSGNQIVFNLMTQATTDGASYDAVWRSLVYLETIAESVRVNAVALPQIGAGLGGLNWNVIKAMLIEIFSSSAVDVIVYEKYIPRQKL